MSKKSYAIKRFSPTASRLDFSKIQHSFTPPKLHELQVEAYKRFLDVELDQLLRSYFPIESPSKQFRLEYLKLSFHKPERTEIQACDEGKTYEIPLYVDLVLVDTITGAVKKSTKSSKSKKKKGVEDENGVFFANVPMMTENGSFIINGIEKFVVAQIVRSPGIYVSSKAQVKFLSLRKRAIDGYVCELLPYRGALMFFHIDEIKQCVNVILRGSMGESSKVLVATVLLKALGITGREISRIYGSNRYVVSSLAQDGYNEDTIFESDDVAGYVVDYEDSVNRARSAKGLSIDQKLRSYVYDYLDVKHELEQACSSDQSALDSSDRESKIASLKQDLQLCLDKIISEKAAKDVVITLSIGIKNFGYSVSEEKQSYHYLL